MMPEDSRKNADKKKHEPKEQRKPRHSRNQGKSDRKAELVEETKLTPKGPQKPVYEDPGPEFYKSLKRETDEIVKITEAENAKYKKKEIQSNWAKYEMPIESYEDLDEQDVGADYEKLIQAPLSSGGHFQFKHEKSWDTSTAPSLYDKYFEINMDRLSMAISTVPFFERNDINQSEFSESDLLSMNSRASKYKLKYFNDKTYSTAETEAQDRILRTLKDLNIKNKEDLVEEKTFEEITEQRSDYEVNLDFNVTKTDSVISIKSNKQTKPDIEPKTNETVDDKFIFKDIPNNNIDIPEAIVEKIGSAEKEFTAKANATVNPLKKAENKLTPIRPTDHPVAPTINPVIESPEDLEKWLDDFLD